MTLKGHIKNGKVELDEPTNLTEGMEVQVTFLVQALPPNGAKRQSVVDRLAHLVGAAKDLPPDLAENHDHYLHGQAKR